MPSHPSVPDNKWEHLPVGCVESHFLDSGSFTLWTQAAKYAKENKSGKWSFYDTPKFWEYIDAYADFVKKYAAGIDFYANVDVIPEPKLSWRNLQYLENHHGLTPIPVVHYTTDLKWIHKHIDEGYDYIALGGLVGSMRSPMCKKWLDDCFNIICDTPDRLPKVKVHGFGVTNYRMLLRYPWASVDSTTWTKVGAYGGIMVPHKRNGKYTFLLPPYVIQVSSESSSRGMDGRHFYTLSQAEQNIVTEWLAYVDVPLGKMNSRGKVLEWGVITRHTERRCVNLLFFEMFRNSLPKYPWPFTAKTREGFNIPW